MQVLKNDKLLKKTRQFCSEEATHIPHAKLEKKRISGVITVVYVDEISILQMDWYFYHKSSFLGKRRKKYTFLHAFYDLS